MSHMQEAVRGGRLRDHLTTVQLLDQRCDWPVGVTGRQRLLGGVLFVASCFWFADICLIYPLCIFIYCLFVCE